MVHHLVGFHVSCLIHFVIKDEFDYDISPYSGADETLSNGSVSEDFISQTLPTVYSPTPSIPTISSPQSATSIQPGYFEVYRVCPIRPIDASSSSATFPSFSFAAPTTDPGQSPQSFKINVPILKDTLQLKHIDDPKSEDASSPPHSSAKTLISCRQKEGVVHPPVSRKQSHASCNSWFFWLFCFVFGFACGFRVQFMSVHSSPPLLTLWLFAAVKSGGYYMFEDLDTDEVDLEHKHRASLIPDPEGNEIRNLAKSKGFTAVSYYHRFTIDYNWRISSFALACSKVKMFQMRQLFPQRLPMLENRARIHRLSRLSVPSIIRMIRNQLQPLHFRPLLRILIFPTCLRWLPSLPVNYLLQKQNRKRNLLRNLFNKKMSNILMMRMKYPRKLTWKKLPIG